MNTSQDVLELRAFSNVSQADTDKTAAAFGHFPALDGLRGVAVLIVMAYHLEYLLPGLSGIVKGGFLGVDVFFVLSGFLITSILLKEQSKAGQINLKNFYMRRVFRLIPAYWTFLIILYFFGNQLLQKVEASVIYSNNNFFFAFAYLQNWRSCSGIISGNLNHTWSLAIEEQFYILWSLILFFAFKQGLARKQITLITVGLVAVIVIQRAARIVAGTDAQVLYYSTDTRIDALLIGSVAAMIYTWKLIPLNNLLSRKFNIAAFSSLIVAITILMNFGHTDFDIYFGILSIFAISVAILILWLVTQEKNIVHKLFENRVLTWIGNVSYALYLWHYLSYQFAKKTFDSRPVQVIAGIAFTFAAAALSYYLIEKPFLRLKSRYS